MPKEPLTSAEKIYLDTCVWIGNYDPAKEFVGDDLMKVRHLFTEVESGSRIVIASAALFAEALTVSHNKLDEALDGRYGMPVAADVGICRKAREMQDKCYAKTGKALQPIDSIHLVTASEFGCTRFITTDVNRKNNNLAPISDRAILEPLLRLKIVHINELPMPPALTPDPQTRFEFPEDGHEV